MTTSRSSLTGPKVLALGLTNLVLTLAALLVVMFALSKLSPVDPVLALVGDHASRSSYLQMRHALGLDASWLVQLLRYLQHLGQGDLGTSIATGRPVADDLRRVFPATAELATLAMVLSAFVGLVLAGISVHRPGGSLDAMIRLISLVGSSIPIFWLGLIALLVFYARLNWVDGPGQLDDAFQYTIDMPSGIILLDAWRSGVPGAFASAVSHLILPVLILASYAIGNITRLTRAALLAERDKEYVTLARAKGAGELRVLWTHVRPNAAGLILTVLALTYANLLEGAVLVETVFARPGLGRYLTTALFAGDRAAILGATLLIGVCFVVINGVTDVLVRLSDPRAR